MMQEFREFAVKGNVIDLAVGVIIGGAFGKIVTSMVDDIIMPIVGSIFGNLDFTSLYVALGKVPEGTAPTLAALRTAGVPTLAYQVSGEYAQIMAAAQNGWIDERGCALEALTSQTDGDLVFYNWDVRYCIERQFVETTIARRNLAAIFV